MDLYWIALKVLAVGVLVFLNGFFVAAEFALVKLRDTQLEPLIVAGHRRASLSRKILHNLDAYLSACQLGITLASLGLGWVGEPIFSDLLAPLFDQMKLAPESAWRHGIAFGVGFTVITVLHITAGEQAPKWYAIQRPLPTTLWIAYPMRWFYCISYPFVWGLNAAALWMLRMVGIQADSESGHNFSEDELRTMLTSNRKTGEPVKFGRDIVLNAFDLKNRVACEVMHPRREIVGFNTEAPITECLDLAERTRHSRFPLCVNGSLDDTKGVVHIKDLYAQRRTAQKAGGLLPFARQLVYVPESARLERLLHIFLDRKLHFGLVVNEFGDTVGMITLENILEELVGQIQDEFDHEQPMFKQADEDNWDVLGAMPLHELSELTGESCEEKGVTTVSGLITRRLGTFPREGDKLRIGRFELRVEQTYRLQVEQARLTRLEEEEESD
jgi:CBS domain containing-hemolysin-like protein